MTEKVRENKKQTMSEADIEAALAYTEEVLVRYGAVPEPDVDIKRRNALGFRMCYRYQDTYFRTEAAEIDGVPVILIHGIDDIKMADVGIDDPLAAFPADSSRERIEKEIRFMLET